MNLLISASAVAAAPHMLGVFGDNMVLQHDSPRVQGCGVPPLHPIAVMVAGQQGSFHNITRLSADTDGCFVAVLTPRPPMTSGADAVTIEVKIAVGNASSPYFAVAKNVMWGHVILCAGQR